MTVYFTNRCRHIIILNIDDGEPVLLQPFETKPIARNDSDVIKILAKRNCESTKKSSMYHLIIETKYHFTGVIDGTVFTITREKIQFSLKASYDRLFLWATNASYLSENHKVVSEEKMKKAFDKSRLIDILWNNPNIRFIWWIYINAYSWYCIVFVELENCHCVFPDSLFTSYCF